MRTLVVAMIGVLLLSAPTVDESGLCAQEAANPDEAPAQNAVDLLERAIRHQGPEKLSKAGAIRDFTIRMACTVMRLEGERRQRQAVTVSRFLRLLPEERFCSETKISGPRMIRGFNGKRCWLDDGQAARFLMVTILKATLLDEDGVKLNSGLKDATFEPPRRDAE